MFRKCLIAAVLSTTLVGGLSVPASAALPAAPMASQTPTAPDTVNIEQVRITGGLGVYANMWHWELAWIMANLLRAQAGGLIGACAAAKVPAQYGAIAKILCAAGGAVGMAEASAIAARLLAQTDAATRAGVKLCFQMKVAPFNPKSLHLVNRSHCR